MRPSCPSRCHGHYLVAPDDVLVCLVSIVSSLCCILTASTTSRIPLAEIPSSTSLTLHGQSCGRSDISSLVCWDSLWEDGDFRKESALQCRYHATSRLHSQASSTSAPSATATRSSYLATARITTLVVCHSGPLTEQSSSILHKSASRQSFTCTSQLTTRRQSKS